MAVQFQVFRADGKLQFDASLPTYSFVGKGSKATQARFGSNTAPSTLLIPADSRQMVALRAPFYVGRSGISGSDQVFHTEGAVGSIVDYWIFAATPAIQAPPSSAGLWLYDEQGRMTYSSDLKVLRVGGLLSHSEGENNVAALPAGRTYATIYPSFSGHGYETEEVQGDGGPVIIDPGNPGEPGRDQQWYRRVNGKLYGTRWDGSTCDTGEVSFDDVMGLINYGSQPDPAREFWRNDMVNALLVDVTHL